MGYTASSSTLDRVPLTCISLGSAALTSGALLILQDATDDAAAGGEGAPVVRVVGDFSVFQATSGDVGNPPIVDFFVREAICVLQADSDNPAVLMPIDLWAPAGLADESILQMRQRYVAATPVSSPVDQSWQGWSLPSAWDVQVSRLLNDNTTLVYTAQARATRLPVGSNLYVTGYFRVLRKHAA